MATVLKCKICHNDFSKKEVLLSAGKVLDDGSCICKDCIIAESDTPATREPASRRYLSTVPTMIVVLLLAGLNFFLYQKYQKEQEKEKWEQEFLASVLHGSVDLQLKIKAIEEQYEAQLKVIDMKLTQVDDSPLDDLTRKRLDVELSMAKGRIIMEKSKKTMQAQLEYFYDTMEELKTFDNKDDPEFKKKMAKLRAMLTARQKELETLSTKPSQSLTLPATRKKRK